MKKIAYQNADLHGVQEPAALRIHGYAPGQEDVPEMVAKGLGRFLMEKYQQAGPVFSIVVNQQPAIAVMDYDALKVVLITILNIDF